MRARCNDESRRSRRYAAVAGLTAMAAVASAAMAVRLALARQEEDGTWAEVYDLGKRAGRREARQRSTN